MGRRLRREGDSRTLAQLRSDVALDLLLHGELPASLPADVLAGYATFGGALPAARVDVTVSAATLLGVSDQPGSVRVGGREEHVSARLVRNLAYRAGSVWRRLLTDPATGYMVDYSSTRYEVTGELRERVFARDHLSRVPGSTRPAAVCDTDHDVDYPEGGPTSESNVSAKNRRGHNHNTHHRWTSEREPGVHGAITWTTGAGRTYSTTPSDHRDPDTVDFSPRAQAWRSIRAHLRASVDVDPPDEPAPEALSGNRIGTDGTHAGEKGGADNPTGADDVPSLLPGSAPEDVGDGEDTDATGALAGWLAPDPSRDEHDGLPLIVHRPVGPRRPGGFFTAEDVAEEHAAARLADEEDLGSPRGVTDSRTVGPTHTGTGPTPF